MDREKLERLMELRIRQAIKIGGRARAGKPVTISLARLVRLQSAFARVPTPLVHDMYYAALRRFL